MKLLIASLLLLSSTGYAKITQAPNVSVTAAADDADSVAKGNSYIYGMDSTGVNRRVQLNASGQIVMVSGGGGSNQFVVITSTVTALGVSSTTRLISAPTVINLTTVAGIDGPMEVIFGGTTNSPTGVYYRFTGSSAWPVNGAWHLFSISTTPVALTNRAPGSHLLLSPTSATDISFTAVVDIQSLAVRQ